MLIERQSLFSQQEITGTFLVTVSGMCFGWMSYFGTKLFYLNFSVANMLFWRFLIATIFLFSILPFRKKTVGQHRLRSFAILKIFILSAISYSLASGLYFLACKHISTGIAMVIFFSFPVFVSLFSWLFEGWHFNRIAIFSLSAVILGLIFLKNPADTHVNVVGILLSLTAAFFFASYVYGSKLTTKNMDARWLSLSVCSGNMLIFLFLALATHTYKLPDSLHAWLYVFAIGIVATALPIHLLLNGLKFVSPVKASILSVLEPVVTVIVGFALLNETMSHMQMLGVMIVLLGAILIQFEGS